MNSSKTQTQVESNWYTKAVYEKVDQDINEWPKWKKELYNEMFAVSAHAKKLMTSK